MSPSASVGRLCSMLNRSSLTAHLTLQRTPHSMPKQRPQRLKHPECFFPQKKWQKPEQAGFFQTHTPLLRQGSLVQPGSPKQSYRKRAVSLEQWEVLLEARRFLSRGVWMVTKRKGNLMVWVTWLNISSDIPNLKQTKVQLFQKLSTKTKHREPDMARQAWKVVTKSKHKRERKTVRDCNLQVRAVERSHSCCVENHSATQRTTHFPALVDEESLKAPSSAPLSSLLVYQAFSCLSPLQITTASLCGPLSFSDV